MRLRGHELDIQDEARGVDSRAFWALTLNRYLATKPDIGGDLCHIVKTMESKSIGRTLVVATFEPQCRLWDSRWSYERRELQGLLVLRLCRRVAGCSQVGSILLLLDSFVSVPYSVVDFGNLTRSRQHALLWRR